jgi:hypothetical protein
VAGSNPAARQDGDLDVGGRGRAEAVILAPAAQRCPQQPQLPDSGQTQVVVDGVRRLIQPRVVALAEELFGWLVERVEDTSGLGQLVAVDPTGAADDRGRVATCVS